MMGNQVSPGEAMWRELQPEPQPSSGPSWSDSWAPALPWERLLQQSWIQRELAGLTSTQFLPRPPETFLKNTL